MRKISRRQFLRSGAMGIGAVGCLSLNTKWLFAEPFDWPVSFQSWGMREILAEDFNGTLRRLSEMGFKGIEMCSPEGYKKLGFGPLAELSANEIQQKIKDAGLFCKTCHFQRWQLQGEALQATIEYGKALGLKDLVIADSAVPKDASLDQYKRAADDMNKSGAQVKKAGLQLVYHNHTIGPELEGVPLYDHWMRLFDAELIKMQFQIISIRDGYDVIDYLAKYPGRYISLHMADWDLQQKKVVPIGQGMINWKKLLTTAKQSGIADYGMIVEITSKAPDDGFKVHKSSYDYLNNLDL